MNFGYANGNAKQAASTQAAALRAYDPKIKVWTEEKGASEDFDHIVDKRKTGSCLARGSGHAVVVAEFHQLATNRDELTQRVQAIHKLGAVIIEVSSRRSTEDRADLAAMMVEALDYYRIGGMSKAERTRVGKLGAAASPVTKAKDGRMAASMAIKFLYDPSLSIKEALGLIAKDKRYKVPWTMSYAYKQHRDGKIQLPKRAAGRRPNEK